MAKTFTLVSQSYDGRYLQVDCTQTIDIATNTSTINWTLSALGGNSNYYTTGATTLTINGTQVYYKARTNWNTNQFPAAKGSTSGTLKVAHTNNGSKAINVSLATAIYTSGIVTTTKAWTLDNIPRKATINTAPNFTDETASFDITYSNLSSADISLCISSDKQKVDLAPYRALTKSATKYTFTLTDAERKSLRDYSITKGSAAFTVYFILKTVIGSYTDYHTIAKTCTIANCAPILNPTVKNTGEALFLTDNESVLIAGFGETAVAANAQALKGATITKYSITCGDNSLSTATGIIRNAVNDTFNFSVTDNRGLTTTKQVKLTMLDYVKPTCSIKAQMPTTDGELTFTVEGLGWFGDFGGYFNSLNVAYRIKENSGEYGEWQSLEFTEKESSYEATDTITGLNYRSNYTIQAMAQDMLISAYSDEIVTQTIPVFDWGKNDFNFNVPVSINGVTLDYIVEQGTSNGWTYRLWNSGIAECWRRLQITTNVTNSWGNLFTSGALSATNLAYPFTFTETPILNVSLGAFGSGGLVMATGNNYGSATTTGAFEIARGASASNLQFLLNYQAIGKWK